MTISIRTALRVLAGVCALAPAAALAQTDPRAAQPERPTVATHAYTVAPGYFEFEVGAQYQNPQSFWSAGFPVNLKLGIAPRVQLNVIGSFGAAESTSSLLPGGGGNDTETGVGDLTVAAKVRVADGLPVLGDFSVQPSVKFSTATDGFGTGTTDGGVLLISSHPFSGGEIDVNAGITFRDGDGTSAPKTSTLVAVAGGFSVAGPLGLSAEVFAYPGTSGDSGSPTAIGFLTGPTYKVNRSLILDGGVILDVQNLGTTSVYVGLTANAGRVF